MHIEWTVVKYKTIVKQSIAEPNYSTVPDSTGGSCEWVVDHQRAVKGVIVKGGGRG